MVDILTLFQVSITNIDIVLDMYDLSAKERYHLKKIKGYMEVYLREKIVDTSVSIN